MLSQLSASGLSANAFFATSEPLLYNNNNNSPADTSTVQYGGTQQQGESPCLPKQTVCIITGNNRTKKSLVGQRVVVRRGVGLGGWYELILPSGSTLKLQRNALTVVEYGPSIDTCWTGSQTSSDTEAREPQIDSSSFLQSGAFSRPIKASSSLPDLPLFKAAAPPATSSLRSSTYPLVNLHKLDTISLKRYRRVFQLSEVDAAAQKEALLLAVQRHFTTQEVEESAVLTDFVATIRRRSKRQHVMLQACPRQDQDGAVYEQHRQRQQLYNMQQRVCLFQ